jgi:hypothetical protein
MNEEQFKVLIKAINNIGLYVMLIWVLNIAIWVLLLRNL